MKVKQLFLSLLLLFITATPGFAIKTFITTINNTDVEEVHNTAIPIFLERNFSIGEMTPYKIEFQKSEYRTAWKWNSLEGQPESCLMLVRLHTIAQGDNVKIIATEIEETNSIGKHVRSIDFIVPLIRELKSSIDGTPLDAIANEVPKKRKSDVHIKSFGAGLKLAKKKNTDNFPVIEAISPESIAEKAGLKAGDVILSLNLKSVQGCNLQKLQENISDRVTKKRAVVLSYLRDGKEYVAKLRK